MRRIKRRACVRLVSTIRARLREVKSLTFPSLRNLDSPHQKIAYMEFQSFVTTQMYAMRDPTWQIPSCLVQAQSGVTARSALHVLVT